MESEDEEEIVVNIDVETGGYLFEWNNSFNQCIMEWNRVKAILFLYKYFWLW